jgi:integrase
VAYHERKPDASFRRHLHVPGEPLTQQAATNKIRRELARLGIIGASHHTMRHTGVTLMLEAGVNPRTIQRLAGWTSLRMLERYGHARDAEARRAVSTMHDKLEAAIQSTSTNREAQNGAGAQKGHKTGHTPFLSAEKRVSGAAT